MREGAPLEYAGGAATVMTALQFCPRARGPSELPDYFWKLSQLGYLRLKDFLASKQARRLSAAAIQRGTELGDVYNSPVLQGQMQLALVAFSGG